MREIEMIDNLHQRRLERIEGRDYDQAIETNDILYNYLWGLYSEGSKYYNTKERRSELVSLMNCTVLTGFHIQTLKLNFERKQK